MNTQALLKRGGDYRVYWVLAPPWVLSAWLLGRYAVYGQLLPAFAASLLLGAPLLLEGLYGNTVRKIHTIHAFSAQGWLYWLYTRRLLATVFWFGWSALAGFAALFWFAAMTPAEWLLTLACLMVFPLVFKYYLGAVAQEFRPFMRVHRALQLSRWSVSAAMALLYPVIVMTVTAEADRADTLAQLLQDVAAKPLLPEQSWLLQLAARAADYYHGLHGLVLGHLASAGGWLGLLLLIISAWLVFFNLCLALSAFLVPPREYRRLVNPVADIDSPPAVSPARAAQAAAVTVVILLFMLLPLMAGIEHTLRQQPDLLTKWQSTEAAVIPVVEEIGGALYRAGTRDEIQTLQLQTLATQQDALRALQQHADSGFALMSANVESYLDWYYSLTAEYLRLLALLSNNLEQQLQQQLMQHLLTGDPLAALEEGAARLAVDSESWAVDYRKQRDSVLANNAVDPAAQYQLQQAFSAESIAMPQLPDGFISFEQRVAGAGAGAISAMVAAKVLAKTMSKGTLKLAAQAVGKVAAGKVAGGGAGAAAGAALGSVVPGPGTLAGALVGGLLGLVFGVAMDAALLELDEFLSREEFRAEILAAIDEARLDFHQSLVAGNSRAPQ